MHSSILLAFLASYAVGAFQVGFNLFGSQTLGLTTTALAVMFITCSLAMLVAQFALIFSSVRGQIDQRLMAAAFVSSAFALALTSHTPDAMSLGLMIAMVATSIGMIGPVLSYELLEIHSAAPGALLGQQTAASNLGQALGSINAGSLFALVPTAPFWAAALVMLVGAALSLISWGPARRAEITAGELQNH